MVDHSDTFEASACFDPNSITHHQQLLTDRHDLSNFHQFPNFSAIEAPANHFLHQHFMQTDMNHQNLQQINWNHNLHDQFLIANNDNNCLTTPDLFNFFQLPNSSSSICFSNPTRIDQTSGQIMYDPLELLKSLPNGSNWTGCGSNFAEMDMDRGDQSQLYHEGDAVFEFNGRIVNRKRRHNKDIKQFATEKHRRQLLNGKFEALRSLIPNPTKGDRASIIGDAIDYINKLKRDSEELKLQVDRKRFNKGRMQKLEIEDETGLDVASIYTRNDNDQQVYNGNSTSTMKSSWLQKKSKNIEIDVRIVDDEVTIKLVQQKKINCLLLVSRVLDEFQLNLHHVGGGLIGDFYSYLFNNKICDGSSVYASAIANKVIEVVEKEFASISVSFSC